MEQDLEFEEDQALGTELSSGELEKYLQSFDIYFSDIYDKRRKSLLFENTVLFNDSMRRLHGGTYSGFKDLLAKISTKISIAKQYCPSKDVDLLDLLNDALDLINNYLKNYETEKTEPEEYKKYIEKYPQQKYSKYKYPYYKYNEDNKQSDRVSKEYGKKLAYYLKARNSPKFDRENPVEQQLINVIDNLDTKEEVPDPIDKIFQDALAQIKDKKLEVEKRKLELQELSDKKTELSDKATQLANYRKAMLGKFIDQMIKTEQER